MPVVACPNCRAELDLDPDDIGHRVECPGCLTQFVATRPVEKSPEPSREGPPPAIEPPPPPASDTPPPPTEPAPESSPPPPVQPPRPTVAKPRASVARPSERPSSRPDNSPVTLSCPACRGAVSVSAGDLGHRVECPMCQQVFRAEDPERPSGRRSSRRDDSDDEPSWRRRDSRRGDSRRSRYDDEDDEDDDYDRPRRRRRSYRDEDPYESPDPKAWVWQAKRDLATPGGGLQVLGWLDVVYGGLYVLIGVLIGLGVSGGGGGAGGPTWEVVAMTIGLGVSGILMGGVKAFGGMEMKKVRNRRLGIIACVAACVPIYLLACLLMFFGPQYAFTCCPAPFTLPSYIVGIVFGIMGMTKLFRRVMNKAFEVNRPDGDIDTV